MRALLDTLVTPARAAGTDPTGHVDRRPGRGAAAAARSRPPSKPTTAATSTACRRSSSATGTRWPTAARSTSTSRSSAPSSCCWPSPRSGPAAQRACRFLLVDEFQDLAPGPPPPAAPRGRPRAVGLRRGRRRPDHLRVLRRHPRVADRLRPALPRRRPPSARPSTTGARPTWWPPPAGCSSQRPPGAQGDPWPPTRARPAASRVGAAGDVTGATADAVDRRPGRRRGAGRGGGAGPGGVGAARPQIELRRRGIPVVHGRRRRRGCSAPAYGRPWRGCAWPARPGGCAAADVGRGGAAAVGGAVAHARRVDGRAVATSPACGRLAGAAEGRAGPDQGDWASSSCSSGWPALVDGTTDGLVGALDALRGRGPGRHPRRPRPLPPRPDPRRPPRRPRQPGRPGPPLPRRRPTSRPGCASELAQPGDADGVRLSTVHRVKGLEWPHVVVHDASDALFPHRLTVGRAALEEERRVFHVAITRCRSTCTVVAPAGAPSPFVAELEGGRRRSSACGPASRRLRLSARPAKGRGGGEGRGLGPAERAGAGAADLAHGPGPSGGAGRRS